MAGRILPLEGRPHPPAAHEHRAAGGLSLWIQNRLRDLAVVLVVVTMAVGVFMAGMAILALLLGQALAQTPGAQTPGPGAVGGVTVTAPSCKNPQDPAPACAAQRLDQAAKAAEAKGQASVQSPPTITVPDAQSPAAVIGLGTPAAAAQQPGTPFGKPPGYVPPPPPGAVPPGGAFTRTPR